MQNSFLIYADYEKHFKLLDDVERGKLIMAMFALNRGEDITDTLNAPGQMALSFIKDQMKRDSDSYERSKLSRSEAGKKGMEARWGKKNSDVITSDNKDNNVINAITPDNTTITSNNNDNYNVNDNVNVDVNVNDNVKKSPSVMTDAQIVAYVKENIKDEAVCKKFLDYCENRKAMGKKYAIRTKATLDLNIGKLRKYASTVEEALEMLDYSIANNYQGLFELKREQKKTTTYQEKQKLSKEEAEAWNE